MFWVRRCPRPVLLATARNHVEHPLRKCPGVVKSYAAVRPTVKSKLLRFSKPLKTLTAYRSAKKMRRALLLWPALISCCRLLPQPAFSCSFLHTQNHRRITQDPVHLERLLSRRLLRKTRIIKRDAGLCLCQPEAPPPGFVGS